MKRSVTVRVICLIIAGVVLSGAVAFAAVLGSPYDTLKRAALTAAAYTNVTVEAQMTMSVGGVVQETQKSHNINSENGSLYYSFDEFGNPASFHFNTNGLNMSGGSIFTEGNVDWYSAQVSPRNDLYSRGNGVFLNPEDLNSARVRFMELLIDAVVGDLKNNITMTSSDGIRTVRGTLTENQIPELVKAWVDMMVEQQGAHSWQRRNVSFNGGQHVYEEVRIVQGTKTATVWRQPARAMTREEQRDWEDGNFFLVDYWGVEHFDDRYYIIEGRPEMINEYSAPATRSDYSDGSPWDIPMRSLAINYVRGEADIDARGNLLSISGSAAATVTNIFGDVNEFEFETSVRFTNIGTSSPTIPIPGAEQILTPENMSARFGSERVFVYFTLNEDGSINESSLTTTFPGERDMRMQRDMYSSGGPFSTVVSAEIVADSVVIQSEDAYDEPGEPEAGAPAEPADGEAADDNAADDEPQGDGVPDDDQQDNDSGGD